MATTIARMVATENDTAPDDGVARFNDLYLAVTREVAAEAESGRGPRPRSGPAPP